MSSNSKEYWNLAPDWAGSLIINEDANLWWCSGSLDEDTHEHVALARNVEYLVSETFEMENRPY